VAAFMVAAMSLTTTVHAQTGTPVEGAPEFLFPVGARSIGMGQAAVALSVASEALWWNPALISRGPRDFSVHIGNSLATSDGGADFSASIVFPITGVGAIGLGVRYLSFGQLAAVDTSGQIQTGTFQQESKIIVGTFSAPFGDHLSAGISLKFLQQSFPCTGTCDLPTSAPETGAIDVGAQYIVNKDSTIVFGAAVRSVGPKLQVNDAPQADALPNRLDVGVAFSPRRANWPKEIRVRGAADMVTRPSRGVSPGYRIGGEVSYLDRLQARAGYLFNDPGESGPTLGLGFSTGRLQIDFAQARTDAAGAAGKQPSYLSLRYSF
jgi:hypothetical protein